ncbi:MULTISPECIES: hypothetical protein [unclassified Streptomyces]|uniref:hypothetical protein n=1 Tax=unclassified Streptomyces TaxID=2593676 RepID=UPI001BE787E7|nr:MULTISPECIES: hypothetical protein [unclassified Streptomyces]MBT2408642.1 hypothetical protein [Streptomyces sp. ISL-21]MBT2455520.1 hypothetical protein [Streptomyces sp. ISL-86]MBT2608674.1 hypothetical protein [Streptomyces sp. ISL-87]
MTQGAPPGTSPGQSLSTPRAAGLAGVVFAVLLAAAIVLARIALPEGGGADKIEVTSGQRNAVTTAVELVPFAGIAFLWFMGALREHTGAAEDRFVATVFLGSGLIFVATLFGSAAAAGTVLDADQPQDFGRHYAYTLLMTYGMRMAAVFVFATSTIGRRLGVFPRWLTLAGSVAGLVLLVIGSAVPWSELVFPAWSLIVSLYILRARRRSP